MYTPSCDFVAQQIIGDFYNLFKPFFDWYDSLHLSVNFIWLQDDIGKYKESVELTFVYLSEGCGKTQLEINDTIPHTRIDMRYRGTQNVPVHRYLYEVSVVPYRPSN